MKKFATLALTSLSVLTLASCGLLDQAKQATSATSAASSAASSAGAAASSAASSATSAASSAVAAAQAALSQDDAKAKAFEALGINEADVTNLMVQADNEDGRPVYEIDFMHNGVEHNYTVDANSGEFIERETEAAATSAASTATAGAAGTTAAGATLSQEEAKAIALNDFASVYGTTEADLMNLTVREDSDNGMVHYDIDFIYNGSEVSYEIDGATGEFLSYEID